MSAEHPLKPLARTWWIALVVALAAVLVSYLLTRRQTPTYRSSATVVVIPNGATVEAVRDVIDGLANLDRRNVVATLARVTHSQEVVSRAVARAGLDEDEARRHRVRSIVLPNTNIIEIEAVGPDPEIAAALANAVAAVAESETVDLYRIYRLKLLDGAVVSRRPVSPDLRRNLLVASVLGVLGGIVVAVGIDRGIRSLRPAAAA